ncbi:MAG: hypothetical protein HQK51_20515, partial [Oligoflexia bacterium]|nr:hypothetical protein [Oligoflexia bacterium]
MNFLKRNANQQSILIVAHDAGGGEILSAWIKAKQQKDRLKIFTFLLEGPAIKIFQKKISSLTIISRESINKKYLSTFDLVLTATSWACDLEKVILLKSKDCK